MNALRSIILKRKMPGLIVNASRNAAYWNKNWMPGPFPVTPEQRAAAAKKYNLLPEEYEPVPDGECGDYPNLPMISGASKDMNYNWDDPGLLKDCGETMHEKYNLISWDRWDCNYVEKQQIHPVKQILISIGVIGGMYLVYVYFHRFKISLPHMKRHNPADGVHYKYPKLPQ